VKRCSKCGETRPVSEFGPDRRASDGLQSQCRVCTRAYDRVYARTRREDKREYDRAYRERNRGRLLARRKGNAEMFRRWKLAERFGITPEQYDALLAYQGGVCAGCGTDACKTGRRFAVDHDHTCCPPNRGSQTAGACGKCVRGILCLRCNWSNALAGAPHVDWAAVMKGGQS
jgi:hypothetical protein